MKKVIILLTLLALCIGTFSCGQGAGSSSHPHGENQGIISVVTLSPSQSIAQTNAFIYLHARVLDGNGVPVKNQDVTFTNLTEPFGVIQKFLKIVGIHKSAHILSASTVKTDDLGIATVKITSTTAGFATIQAEVNTGAGIVRDKKTVFFTISLVPVTPSAPTMKLHVDDGDGTFDENDDFNLFKAEAQPIIRE